MTTGPISQEEFQQQVLRRLDRIDGALEKLGDRVDKLDYKFETYQNASDSVTRMAITIIITAGTVVVFSSVLPTLAPAIEKVVSRLVGGA